MKQSIADLLKALLSFHCFYFCLVAYMNAGD